MTCSLNVSMRHKIPQIPKIKGERYAIYRTMRFVENLLSERQFYDFLITTENAETKRKGKIVDISAKIKTKRKGKTIDVFAKIKIYKR